METETCPRCKGRGTMPTNKSLRPIRQAMGWGLGEVARVIGVSTPYLSEIERGSRRVTPFIALVYDEIYSGGLSETSTETWKEIRKCQDP